MKTMLRFVSCIALVAMFCVGLGQLASTACAQAVQVGESSQAVAAASQSALGDVVAAVSAVVPHWVTVALSIFGTVSLGYQALIAWAHKRAAETAEVQDDAWLASLEAKPWFKILDRIFYWGGYLGSRMGGKKL